MAIFISLHFMSTLADTELEELESLKFVTPGNTLIRHQHAAVDAKHGDVS